MRKGKVLVTQSYPALCNPMEYSPPGFSVHGILQARILEWVAIPFSRGSSRPRDGTQVSSVSCTAGGFFTVWAIREARHTVQFHAIYAVYTIWRRQLHPTPVLLPGKSHGRRSLVGCSPWGCRGSGTTERLHFPFSLSCLGEGNGNPLHVLAWRIPGMGEPGGLRSVSTVYNTHILCDTEFIIYSIEWAI